MTIQEKINWLENATNEELLKQYESTYIYNYKDPLNEEHMTNIKLIRTELFKRLDTHK